METGHDRIERKFGVRAALPRRWARRYEGNVNEQQRRVLLIPRHTAVVCFSAAARINRRGIIEKSAVCCSSFARKRRCSESSGRRLFTNSGEEVG